jgi:glycosyltransferase involved in cell wall biosynthesis
MRIRRIAHVLPFPGIGGTEHATLRIARAVAQYGFESTIVCLHDTAVLREFFAGFPLVFVPAPEPSVRHGIKFLAGSRTLATEFKRLKTDLVHCSDALAGYHAAFAGRLARLPVLCHVRNRHPEMAPRVQFVLRAVTHFAFVSKHTWNLFPLSVPAKKGTVVYDGVDPVVDPALGAGSRIRSEFGIGPAAKLIGMVARVSPQKDYETLIAAAAVVIERHPEARFMVVGDYAGGEINRTYYSKLLEILAKSGMARYFVFTGYRHDVPDFLDAIDIAVLSTHREGLPLVLLEGMARGRPTVATAVDGIPELIDGANGLIYPHEDVNGLASRLLELLDNPENAARIGLAGRHTVLEKFTMQRFTESMLALYRHVLND